MEVVVSLAILKAARANDNRQMMSIKGSIPSPEIKQELELSFYLSSLDSSSINLPSTVSDKVPLFFDLEDA